MSRPRATSGTAFSYRPDFHFSRALIGGKNVLLSSLSAKKLKKMNFFHFFSFFLSGTPLLRAITIPMGDDDSLLIDRLTYRPNKDR